MFESIRKKMCDMRLYKIENEYNYFVYPYKGITPIDTKEIKYLTNIISSKIPKDIDLIFTVETDGIFLALPIALSLGKPIVVARTFNYNMKDFFQFTQETGYYKRELFFSCDLKKIKKIAIVDCIMSTGGTLKTATGLFKKLGVDVEGIYVVINKINYSDTEFISQIKNKFFAIFDAEIKDGKTIVNKSRFYV